MGRLRGSPLFTLRPSPCPLHQHLPFTFLIKRTQVRLAMKVFGKGQPCYNFSALLFSLCSSPLSSSLHFFILLIFNLFSSYLYFSFSYYLSISSSPLLHSFTLLIFNLFSSYFYFSFAIICLFLPLLFTFLISSSFLHTSQLSCHS